MLYISIEKELLVRLLVWVSAGLSKYVSVEYTIISIDRADPFYYRVRRQDRVGRTTELCVIIG